MTVKILTEIKVLTDILTATVEEVTEVAPQFTTQLESIQTTDGGKAHFEAVVSGQPRPTVTWLKDDVKIEEAEEFQISFEEEVASLTIPDVYPEDAGRYTIVAKNVLGTAMSSAELVVEGKSHLGLFFFLSYTKSFYPFTA